ncbi:uncharacterized protein [Aegilops tauschii subsp. strangulata]|uniref:uncharacterized protein n=1 Tax=Aegilops tauschii subsp. strangulata TaxID=200361 RepID=UPI001ABC7CFA
MPHRETNDSSIQHGSPSSSDGIIKIPVTMHDPDFNDIDTNMSISCDHDQPWRGVLHLKGFTTGDFFFLARKEGRNCGVVRWIDLEWLDSMEKALPQLWDIYEESKRDGTKDNLESSFLVHSLT